jgi:hypothetical protein
VRGKFSLKTRAVKIVMMNFTGKMSWTMSVVMRATAAAAAAAAVKAVTTKAAKVTVAWRLTVMLAVLLQAAR